MMSEQDNNLYEKLFEWPSNHYGVEGWILDYILSYLVTAYLAYGNIFFLFYICTWTHCDIRVKKTYPSHSFA